VKSGTRKAQAMSAYIDLFKSDLGQDVLKDLIKSTFFLNTTHVPGDPYTTAFNEGQRALVSRILRTANINYAKLTQMMEQINMESQYGN
jgi:hypothetical protein